MTELSNIFARAVTTALDKPTTKQATRWITSHITDPLHADADLSNPTFYEQDKVQLVINGQHISRKTYVEAFEKMRLTYPTLVESLENITPPNLLAAQVFLQYCVYGRVVNSGS